MAYQRAGWRKHQLINQSGGVINNVVNINRRLMAYG
jgi:hypothetical protein